MGNAFDDDGDLVTREASRVNGDLRPSPGEMAARLGDTDWSATPLGDQEQWSDALKLSTGLILNSGFPMAIRWGPELSVIYNDAYREILGDKHPAAFGKPMREVWPEINDEIGPLCEAIMRGERGAFFAKDHSWRLRRHGNRLEEARFTIGYSPIPDDSVATGIGGLLVTAVETTGRVRGEQALRSRNRKLATQVLRRTRERDRIWQVSEDLLAVGNFEGYFLSVNPAWTRLLGWSEDEIRRFHISELRHPDDAAISDAGRADLVDGVPTVRIENRFRHKDGSWRWIAWTMTADAGLIYVIGRHTTAQKEAAEVLRDSELHFRLLVDGVVDYAIYMLDPRGVVSSWNSGAERIKGYRADEIIGRHFSQFYTAADRVAGIPDRAMAQAAAGVTYEAEGWRVRKDGSQFWASVALSAIRGNRGELLGFAKVTRDITERRQAQDALRRTQERLAQSQKLETLGQFTGAIAHDFNNMLMVVGANTHVVKRRLVDPAALRALEAVEMAAARGETLTRRLLTFSRRQALNPVTIDLRERLDALRHVLTSSARANIQIFFELAECVWPVTVDVPELELALVNIVVNARDAMPDGGIIRIAVANSHLALEDTPDDLAGEFVSISISDTGHGIDPAILSRVFEPFFTTKGRELGTGLGLSQVYGFTRQSSGTAIVASGPARGTTVTLYLPRAPGPVVAAHSETDGHAGRGGNEKILLIEDNLEVQAVTASLLEELGYRVQRADNPDAALELLASGENFNLLFSDIVMPGPMNGVSLARHVRERYPHIAVLLTTGYAPPEELADGVVPILRKPYRIGALSAALRDTLDRGRHAGLIETSG
jgi:PAS domain S-box-containing protein